MAFGMKRSDLQAMAQLKIDDAILLLRHDRPSSAYYLCGYGVEFGLKACIARQISKETIPDKSFIKDVYQHNFPSLVRLAGLEADRREKVKHNTEFGANWAIAAEWDPESRYEAKQSADAVYLINAVNDPLNGVLAWIKTHW